MQVVCSMCDVTYIQTTCNILAIGGIVYLINKINILFILIIQYMPYIIHGASVSVVGVGMTGRVKLIVVSLTIITIPPAAVLTGVVVKNRSLTRQFANFKENRQFMTS